jgi:hypothetical protein
LLRRDPTAAIISLDLRDIEPSDHVVSKQSSMPRLAAPRVFVARPHNAPGPFYSENEGCITCGAPNSVAPDLVGWYEERCGTETYIHCIFHQQPETPDELDRAIEAMHISCVENLRYRGTDHAILERLAQRGMAHLCDAIDNG